ncbi:MAG: DUF1592 domain-containing protein [Bryobacteraceae bacterium]|nr:DUF1592 domain-containing protein [Bryobacteraceae bacterium]
MTLTFCREPLLFLLVTGIALPASPENFDTAQAFLKGYCQSCHQGKGTGGFSVQSVAVLKSFEAAPETWRRIALRVQNGEMPPKGSPAPSLDARESFTQWVNSTLHTQICSSGPTPGIAPLRRLNRDEYAATIGDLLDVRLDVGRSLPLDSAGGEGFDNAAETLFLSPIHSEKYLDAAKSVLNFAATDSRARARILSVRPGPGVSPEAAARRNLEIFLPRAFRRPIVEEDLTPYMGLFRAAIRQREPFDAALLFAIRGVLVAPQFLFRAEPQNPTGEVRPLEQYALATRLSYFLWGSMPDELLFDIAAAGKLNDPEVLRSQVGRLLRNPKAFEFSRRFVEQWLRTRELSGARAPDAALFPEYYKDEDVRSDIRYQPIFFFREIFAKKLSLLNLLDSKFTIATRRLAKLYDLKVEKSVTQQPVRVELPEGSNRGGVLGMAAVLAVSSHPYRTSPVLRGAWVLDSLLGTPPPPPPAKVPKLEEDRVGVAPKSVRERLTQHRDNPACASCHSRIDPIGFALDNYDVVGRWRTEDGGKPVDTSGVLPDGTRINGPAELRTALLDRKDLFVRNLTNKMLGYALGRGLTLKDACTVDSIVSQVKERDYDAQALVEAIVLSMPFRYQAGRPVAEAVQKGTK